jgi:NAD(P)-dependent dehydrogenase (short-subunit alcohol dehydrogenase family)
MEAQGEAGMKRMQAVMSVPQQGEPEDIAWAVVYFASDESKFVTGHVLPVDGGQFMHAPEVNYDTFGEYAEGERSMTQPA